jgi:thiol-disulfide isomerase/thioredoxin
MTESTSKTASPREALLIVGASAALAIVLGISVLPTFNPIKSKLVGLPAAGFTLPVMTGGESGSRVRLGDLRGKVVVVDFWASWCAPCRAEAPIIDGIARKQKGKDVVVLGIATSGDEWPRAAEFATSQGLSYTTLFDEGDHVSNAFQITELPTLVVIDRQGVVAAVRSRMVQEAELETLIANALAAPANG